MIDFHISRGCFLLISFQWNRFSVSWKIISGCSGIPNPFKDRNNMKYFFLGSWCNILSNNQRWFYIFMTVTVNEECEYFKSSLTQHDSFWIRINFVCFCWGNWTVWWRVRIITWKLVINCKAYFAVSFFMIVSYTQAFWTFMYLCA